MRGRDNGTRGEGKRALAGDLKEDYKGRGMEWEASWMIWEKRSRLEDGIRRDRLFRGAEGGDTTESGIVEG